MTTPSDFDKGYHGYRYLMDATGSRQYAVRYDNGMVRPPLQVFDAAEGGKGSFRPNETIFAFDDELQNKPGKDGAMIVSTVAYQITTNADGKPVNLKQIGIDYEMTFSVDVAVPKAVYKLTPDSERRMKDSGFKETFPSTILTPLGSNGFDMRTTASGLVLPGNSAVAAAPFLQSHPDNAALTARALLEKTVPPVAPVVPRKPAADARFHKADAQTLVEKKNLGDGETLKITFNFESRRVTESVKGAGLTSIGFEDYDQTALESAFKTLQDMGGTPRPLEGKKPSLLKSAMG